jgi:transposase InsO family protein
VVVALRRALLVSIDDLLAVVKAFLNPQVSRSGLDRCLRRHGVGNMRDLQAKSTRPKHKVFKAYEPGYLHVDVKYLPQMANETSQRHLFVAIDRATRGVFVRIYKSKTTANARRFLRDLERACPLRILTILTNNGKDRLFGLRKSAATGKHEFDQLCSDLKIEHRLAPPQHPQTNGMVERFKGRIEDVLQSHNFRSGEELETTLHRQVQLYNQQHPQSALGSKTPLQATKVSHKLKPDIFKKNYTNFRDMTVTIIISSFSSKSYRMVIKRIWTQNSHHDLRSNTLSQGLIILPCAANETHECCQQQTIRHLGDPVNEQTLGQAREWIDTWTSLRPKFTFYPIKSSFEMASRIFFWIFLISR